ncbi:cupin-like domain-containing protein [Natronospirillum operosum]|nr:cupin-like domain-containing protein [Natronospirillum operosum]
MTLAKDRATPVGDGQKYLEQFQDLLVQGFENPLGEEGDCRLRLTDGPSEWSLDICFSAAGLHFSGPDSSAASAELTIPVTTAQRLVEDIETVDFRDPEIMSTVRLDGNLETINRIAKALLQPSSDALTRMSAATEKASSAYRIKEVERVERPTELELLTALSEGRPMIVTDPPLPRDSRPWTLDRLANEYGDVPLRVRSAEHQETVAEFVASMRAFNAARVGKIIEGHTKPYTEGCALPEAMRSAFVPGYFSLHDYIEPQIWLGSVPVTMPASTLHRDPMDGFLYQIMGRKRLILYSPDQAPLLYPMKAWNNYQPCWVSPEQPEYQRFPRFKEAQRLEVILQPGELLVQPASWFHEVYCLDSPTFSVSYFYRH